MPEIEVHPCGAEANHRARCGNSAAQLAEKISVSTPEAVGTPIAAPWPANGGIGKLLKRHLAWDPGFFVGGPSKPRNVVVLVDQGIEP